MGAAIEVSGKPTGNEPLTIRLAPCGSARIRLIDSAGKPIAGYRAALQIVVTPGRFQCDFDGSVRGEDLAADAGPGLGYSSYMGGPPTDAMGWATFTGLIPGATYRLLTTESDNISIDFESLEGLSGRTGADSRAACVHDRQRLSESTFRSHRSASAANSLASWHRSERTQLIQGAIGRSAIPSNQRIAAQRRNHPRDP